MVLLPLTTGARLGGVLHKGVIVGADGAQACLVVAGGIIAQVDLAVSSSDAQPRPSRGFAVGAR